MRSGTTTNIRTENAEAIASRKNSLFSSRSARSAIPTAVSAFYLRLMAGLTETFLKQQNREALMLAENQEQLWKALVKATRLAIS